MALSPQHVRAATDRAFSALESRVAGHPILRAVADALRRQAEGEPAVAQALARRDLAELSPEDLLSDLHDGLRDHEGAGPACALLADHLERNPAPSPSLAETRRRHAPGRVLSEAKPPPAGFDPRLEAQRQDAPPGTPPPTAAAPPPPPDAPPPQPPPKEPAVPPKKQPPK